MANSAELTVEDLRLSAHGLPAPKPAAAAPCDEALLRECVQVGLVAIHSRYPHFQQADAEDIVQELAVVYLESRENVRAPQAWFFACAVRRAQRFFKNRRITEPLPENLPAPETNWEAKFISRQLLLSRRADSRQLFGRLFIAGFSASEIATAEQRTTRSVEQHAAKLLKTLRIQHPRERHPAAGRIVI